MRFQGGTRFPRVIQLEEAVQGPFDAFEALLEVCGCFGCVECGFGNMREVGEEVEIEKVEGADED